MLKERNKFDNYDLDELHTSINKIILFNPEYIRDYILYILNKCIHDDNAYYTDYYVSMVKYVIETDFPQYKDLLKTILVFK